MARVTWRMRPGFTGQGTGLYRKYDGNRLGYGIELKVGLRERTGRLWIELRICDPRGTCVLSVDWQAESDGYLRWGGDIHYLLWFMNLDLKRLGEAEFVMRRVYDMIWSGQVKPTFDLELHELAMALDGNESWEAYQRAIG